MAKILMFKLKAKPNRRQALAWLCSNSVEFPQFISGSVGHDLFHGWRFIQATDGTVYFADCIHEGITKKDLHEFKLCA